MGIFEEGIEEVKINRNLCARKANSLVKISLASRLVPILAARSLSFEG